MRGLSLVVASGGHSSSRCAGLSLSRPLLLQSTGSRRAGSVVVAHRPSCSVACGIFPDQGSNPCSLHWQADSQPLRHQGSPQGYIFALKSKDVLKNTFPPPKKHFSLFHCHYIIYSCVRTFLYVNLWMIFSVKNTYSRTKKKKAKGFFLVKYPPFFSREECKKWTHSLKLALCFYCHSNTLNSSRVLLKVAS